MTDRKTLVHTHIHWRNEKRKNWQRELISKVVELIKAEDHDSLALVARTTGIPPQLRKNVWPILLKYHPMVISPNIMSNTLVWDSQNQKWRYHPETRTSEEVQTLMVHDLNKYFRRRSHGGKRSNTANGANAGASTTDTCVIPSEEQHIIEFLKDCICKFLKKWGQFFKYESGLSWIALALAEWYPFDDNNNVLPGKRHGPPVNLYDEYFLPQEIRSELLGKAQFTFDELFERLTLVILHSPDIPRAEKLAKAESGITPALQYYPVVSGGDLAFQCQMFFKVFSTILPELYQPVSDEETLRPSKKTNWMYWWFKCSGARVLHKQDRARIWDTLLGWRPHPKSLNFYLNYNNKLFGHLYSTTTSSHVDSDFFHKICKYGHDAFWFPDLETLRLGSQDMRCDFQVLSELVRRNKYGTSDEESEVQTENNGNKSACVSQRGVNIPFSLLDPHVQLVFIYMAILQQHEFKLLEFEEAEISEFFNNVPSLSRADDHNYRKLYELDLESRSVSSSETEPEDLSKRPTSSSSTSHMLIEVGDDDKTSNSFDELYNMAGDIWRKWIWRELEDSVSG
ncbi:LANO_0F09186g1_1 [Lachancea nothofagi CBS 11611]|uniref:LANO_0F09186g1_1 n=1 Tax=Lachancea nothofagi CBS 11611 TaxID=1266666 RepID=A0A1G4K9R1_9SACH|nr:LANO_0F09186g1_1 [Lachancea nothofagi CBS 11611]